MVDLCPLSFYILAFMLFSFLFQIIQIIIFEVKITKFCCKFSHVGFAIVRINYEFGALACRTTL